MTRAPDTAQEADARWAEKVRRAQAFQALLNAIPNAKNN